MIRTTLCVGPHLGGWGVQDRGEWRGPYFRQDIAVEIAFAETKRRRSAGVDARLVVMGKDGAVLFQWPKAESAEVIAVERPLAGSTRARPATEKPAAAARPVRLRDWRDAHVRPRFNGCVSLSIG